MKNKTFKIEGFGNFSITYGWDNGVDLGQPVYTDEEFVPSDMFMGRYVQETYSNEHGGSRNVTLIVEAWDMEQALFYARLYCSYYYPEKLDD